MRLRHWEQTKLKLESHGAYLNIISRERFVPEPHRRTAITDPGSNWSLTRFDTQNAWVFPAAGHGAVNLGRAVMADSSRPGIASPSLHIVKGFGEQPLYKEGDRIRISVRYPVAHYRVPTYIRGKSGVVEGVIRRALVNNEEEGFGRNAGALGYYYRVAIPLAELWSGYAGSTADGLRIEVFETWLEKA